MTPVLLDSCPQVLGRRRRRPTSSKLGSCARTSPITLARMSPLGAAFPAASAAATKGIWARQVAAMLIDDYELRHPLHALRGAAWRVGGGR
jgi:hypothetical protein